MSKKVKASHTRYRALGPELIPVYRQSARGWLKVIHPAVGCHYFPPGLRLPSGPQSITALWLVLIYRPTDGRRVSRPGASTSIAMKLVAYPKY